MSSLRSQVQLKHEHPITPSKQTSPSDKLRAEELNVLRKMCLDQQSELKRTRRERDRLIQTVDHLKQLQENALVISEQRDSLQKKLDTLNVELERLSEVQASYETLAREKMEWTSILKSSGESLGSCSPHGIVRMLVDARVELVKLKESSTSANISSKLFADQVAVAENTVIFFDGVESGVALSIGRTGIAA